MDYLRRRFAPVSDEVWKELDEAVARTARHLLSARRMATFDGPRGWEYTGARVGTMRPCTNGDGQAVVCVPEIVPLAEVRCDFSVPWSTIEVFDRGAPALDTHTAEAAAREVALAEELVLYYGEPTGNGFLVSKESPRVPSGDWSKPGQLLGDLLNAVELLDTGGIPGPYEAILAAEGYYAYAKAVADGGYPAARQLDRVLASVHRSVAMRERGGVFSTRGSDFVVTVGGDLSVGYRQHDRDAVHLVCVETIAAQLVTPQAVCLLVR
jgi:uncharacterized linocin/CFP29 family protein